MGTVYEKVHISNQKLGISLFVLVPEGAFVRKQNCSQGAEVVFFRINDVDIRKACKSPKMRLLSKLLVTLQPQWAPLVENMQSTRLKVKK